MSPAASRKHLGLELSDFFSFDIDGVVNIWRQQRREPPLLLVQRRARVLEGERPDRQGLLVRDLAAVVEPPVVVRGVAVAPLLGVLAHAHEAALALSGPVDI